MSIEELDGATWMERTLKVNKAKPRENRRSSFVVVVDYIKLMLCKNSRSHLKI